MSLKKTDVYNETDVIFDEELREPRRFKVILLNDDYTPMDFVVRILMDIFHKPFNEANEIMMTVHERGRGVCGIYTAEIAETKLSQVHRQAQAEGHPLRCVTEEA